MARVLSGARVQGRERPQASQAVKGRYKSHGSTRHLTPSFFGKFDDQVNSVELPAAFGTILTPS